MDIALFERKSEFEWQITPFGRMRVPGVIFASEVLLREMDAKVYEQVTNVAMLPGIVEASYAMPDAHWGYGFPIGGVAAFDPDAGGVVSAGGVGFDISCGVRTLHTGLRFDDIEPVKARLADALYHTIPAGMGSTGAIRLEAAQMDAMLRGGARWAVEQGFGEAADLERIEEGGCMRGADPSQVSEQAKKRQRDEMGTLGSGNHYLEIQQVTDVYADGHRRRIRRETGRCRGQHPLRLARTRPPDRHRIPETHGDSPPPATASSCPTVNWPARRSIRRSGKDYLGAMRAAINCALANRQILTHLTRQVFSRVLPQARLPLLYDVSHNTCKVEEHTLEGRPKKLFVHRKGATRAFGPGHPDLPAALRDAGQPVLIGGSMGTASYILAGTAQEHAARLRLRVSRGGAGDEPSSGAAQLERPARGRRAGRARHPDSQPFLPRGGRGGARRLQGCQRRGGFG